MTAKSIMSTDIETLKPDDLVADALLIMCEKQVHNLPVVDDKGLFVGLFSLRRLTHSLLPKAAQLDNRLLSISLKFMPDESDELLKRLREIGKLPVSELLENKRKLRFCTPDTTLPEMLQLLDENPTSLPVLVVKGEDKHLEGMISNWDVLTRLAINLLSVEGCDEEIQDKAKASASDKSKGE